MTVLASLLVGGWPPTVVRVSELAVLKQLHEGPHRSTAAVKVFTESRRELFLPLVLQLDRLRNPLTSVEYVASRPA